MNRAVTASLLRTQPEQGSEYIYLSDNMELCEALVLIGRNCVYIAEKESEAYFSAEAFGQFVNGSIFHGTYCLAYTYVNACSKRVNGDRCSEALKSVNARVKDGWRLFYNKDFLVRREFQEELTSVLNKFEHNITGPDEEAKFKNRFCKTDRYGNPVGIIDKLIIDHVMQSMQIFVYRNRLYIYDGGVYREDHEGIRVKSFMQELMYTDMIKARTLNGLYTLLLMQESLQVSDQDINRYPKTWINFRNGMLDAVTLRMHPHSPEYNSINQIPHDYVENFLPGRWARTAQFFKESAVADDDIRMMLTYIGLCMTLDTSQQVFMIIKGSGGTGKSRVITLIQNIVGAENISNVSLQDLNKRFYPTALFSKLLNSCADIPADAMEAVDVIKKATGEDVLVYERKGEDAGTFFSYAKLLFSANKIPMNLDEKSNAWYRRMLVYEMDRKPEVIDLDLDAKLSAEIPMTINRAVYALHEMYTGTRTITKSANSCRIVRELHESADSVLAFLHECCMEIPGKSVSRSNLYKAYIEYCSENDRAQYKKRQFFAGVEERGYKQIKSMGEMRFQNLVLTTADVDGVDFEPVERQMDIPFER